VRGEHLLSGDVPVVGEVVSPAEAQGHIDPAAERRGRIGQPVQGARRAG
jgi:hypothetical protein